MRLDADLDLDLDLDLELNAEGQPDGKSCGERNCAFLGVYCWSL